MNNWSCTKCTFSNLPGAPQCVMCAHVPGVNKDRPNQEEGERRLYWAWFTPLIPRMSADEKRAIGVLIEKLVVAGTKRREVESYTFMGSFGSCEEDTECAKEVLQENLREASDTIQDYARALSASVMNMQKKFKMNYPIKHPLFVPESDDDDDDEGEGGDDDDDNSDYEDDDAAIQLSDEGEEGGADDDDDDDDEGEEGGAEGEEGGDDDDDDDDDDEDDEEGEEEPALKKQRVE